MKTARVILAMFLLSLAAACGTKSDLLPPGEKSAPHGEKNPSQPPSPIGQ